MQLTIEGITYNLITIKEFRALHHLPPTFNVNLFENKDYAGLGRIDSAGEALNQLREVLITALPARIPPLEWLGIIPDLTHLFEQQLYGINDQIGLRDVEIDFAVAGFSDALQAYAYAIVYAASTGTPLPTFQMVYTEWLNGTTRLYAEQHTYLLDDQPCTVQIIAHAYGRMGLLIHANQTYAVFDPMLACPAEGFMTSLLTEIARHIQLTTI